MRFLTVKPSPSCSKYQWDDPSDTARLAENTKS